VPLVLVFVVGALVVILVTMVATITIMRESARMEVQPPTRAFDVDEAVEWVVRHIPDDVAGTLTLQDVYTIIDLQLDYFRRKGVSRNGKDSEPGGTVVVGGSETVEYILERASADGAEYTVEQVQAVIDTQLSYLRSIGVVGPAVSEDDAPPFED